MEFSFFKTIIGMKEVQLFFGIIAIGVVIYVVLSFAKPLFRFVLSKFNRGFESVSDADFHELKEKATKSSSFRRKAFYSDEKALFEFKLDEALLERVLFVIIILIELFIIVFNILN